MTERAKRRAKRRKSRTLREIHADAQPKPATVDVKYGYPPVTISGTPSAMRRSLFSAIDPAFTAAMKSAYADLARDLSSQLWGDSCAPTKEFDGLRSMIAEPDPLDEILADAGIKDRPVTGIARFNYAGKLDDLAARNEPDHDWISCDACGVPIRQDVRGPWGAISWIDHTRSETCDGALIPPGRDLRPNPTYRHAPRSGYIDHDDDDAQVAKILAYGQIAAEQRNAHAKVTDLTDS